MSEHTPSDLAEIDEEARREKIRNRAILTAIFVLGCLVALWVGYLLNEEQATAVKAEVATEQAQVEKFNLAQQIAAACADPEGLDEDTQMRLCADARQIVREGPQGAQGIPGVQGPQGVQGSTGLVGAQGPIGVSGLPGVDGLDGDDGAPGPAGPAGAAGPVGEKGETGETGPQGERGEKGETGAVGPSGPAGADGQPPFSWVVYDEDGNVVESCSRSGSFDPDEPTYTCTSARPVVLP